MKKKKIYDLKLKEFIKITINFRKYLELNGNGERYVNIIFLMTSKINLNTMKLNLIKIFLNLLIFVF
jgi:hypothetical protein